MDPARRPPRPRRKRLVRRLARDLRSALPAIALAFCYAGAAMTVEAAETLLPESVVARSLELGVEQLEERWGDSMIPRDPNDRWRGSMIPRDPTGVGATP